MIDHTNVCILKRVGVQNYFLNIVILSPSLGLEFWSVVALFYRTEWNFMQKKQCYLNQHFHILLLLHFFLSQKVLFYCSVRWQYFILLASPIIGEANKSYITHTTKSIKVVPEFKKNKKATFDD